MKYRIIYEIDVEDDGFATAFALEIYNKTGIMPTEIQQAIPFNLQQSVNKLKESQP